MTKKTKSTSSKNMSLNTSMEDNSKIISDIAKKDIEKSFNLESTIGTEAYYSNRYGWTLRKTLS